MANLAIKGHPTRSKEVIEILKMLGGKDSDDYKCSFSDRFYYILHEKHVNWGYFDHINFDKFQIFTLEEFLEKYPYKVGDFVRVPEYETKVCIDDMKWDGFEIQYSVSADEPEYLYEWYSAEELDKYNEPCKEEIMEETNKAIFEGNAHCCDIMNDIIKDNIKERKYAELRMPLDDDDKLSTEVTIDGNKIFPPNNYLIGKVTQVDNGMLVEFVKKQPNYPKTYEDCCEVLGVGSYFEPEIRNATTEECHKFMKFMRLIRCRNVYWKIAGEQMGLGKPWKPDCDDRCFVICNFDSGTIHTYEYHGSNNVILAFPTEEIRDIFYANFKELIEICKEFL